MPYEKNDNELFPKREAQVFYDVGQTDEEEWFVDEIIAHQWTRNKIEFLVKWNLGDSTWEPSSRECQMHASCSAGQSICLDTPKTTTNGGT
jgi:hypothetical protein